MFVKKVSLSNLSAKICSTFLQALAVSRGEIITTYRESNGFEGTPSRWGMVFSVRFSSAFRMERFIDICDDVVEIENVEEAGGS